MKKIVINLIALFWMSVFAVGSASAAGLGFGVTGNWVDVDASGSETVNAGDGGSAQTSSASVSEQSIVPSYYIELTLGDDNDGLAFGYEAIPGSADVSDKTHTRTDTETSVTSTAAATSNSRKFTANAEVEDFKVIYAEIPLGSMFYVRAGMSEITVNTKETASGNGGNYGNATLDGVQYGFGIKGIRGDKIRWKAGWEMNDFDTLNLTSSGNSVTAETNTLTADLDTWAFKFGIGLQF